MKTIVERMESDLKEAMKARAEQKISVLRLAKTALKNKQIDVGHELSDDEVQAVLRTMVKQYQDAISDFQNGGRQDLVERQQQEIDILRDYLPTDLDEAEIERIAKEALQGSDVKEVGRAMGMVMKAVAGRADGTVVRRIVEKLLSM